MIGSYKARQIDSEESFQFHFGRWFDEGLGDAVGDGGEGFGEGTVAG